MANKNFAVPRLDDQTVLNLFRELHNTHPSDSFTLSLAGIENISLRDNLNHEQQEVVEFIDKPGTYIITGSYLSYSNFSINYTRGGDPSQRNIFVDSISITGNGAGYPIRSRLALMSTLDKFFASINSKMNDATDEILNISNLESVYHSTVLKLETKFAEQIEKITSWTVNQAQSYEDRKLQLANEIQSEKESLHADYISKFEEVKRQNQELEELRRKLDDREYMHVRRSIRQDLQKTIADRQTKFSLTDDTQRLRRPIHAAIIILLVLLIAINAVYLHQLTQIDFSNVSLAVMTWAIAKQALAAIAVIGTTLYYVRWMNRWFEQHALAEFSLKKFQLDIDRASWVVETALEWRRDQNREITSALLEGIARNLFEEKDQSIDKSTAADDLASALVGNASQVKLKIGENEMSFDRKGLSALGKTETKNAKTPD
ncbi:hypothetical protein [Bradyrhizobium sp. ORS 285]|uniref:hypothetical protein n=1 Tax=Bradyrhizobium sp. ORS 285 TaxID=115808 RepID=UPI0011125434|nr:hypothetical protein [Bradyrhizobium sp. ORS 285]